MIFKMVKITQNDEDTEKVDIRSVNLVNIGLSFRVYFRTIERLAIKNRGRFSFFDREVCHTAIFALVLSVTFSHSFCNYFSLNINHFSLYDSHLQPPSLLRICINFLGKVLILTAQFLYVKHLCLPVIYLFISLCKRYFRHFRENSMDM